MDVIAHRGGAVLGPENTIETIERSLAAGADGVEIDVRSSADGSLVLMHDRDVSRTTTGEGLVGAMSATELRELGVPTLDEVLECVPTDRLLVVEIKGHPWEVSYDPAEPTANAVAATLSAAGQRRVVISSFNPVALAAVRGAAPNLRTAVLTSSAVNLDSNLAVAVAGGHQECHVPAALLDAKFVNRAREEGRRVVAWTVDDPETVVQFEAWGVDGVICDDPRAATAALKRSG